MKNSPDHSLSNSIGAKKEWQGSQRSLETRNVVDDNNLPDEAYNDPAKSKDGLCFYNWCVKATIYKVISIELTYF